MPDPARQEAIRAYFTTPEPLLHTRTLVLGACLTVLGLLSVIPGEGLGGLWIALVGLGYGSLLPIRARAVPGQETQEARVVSVLRYREARDRFRERESFEQIAGWLEEAIRSVRDASLDRLGLDENSADPVCIVGPLYTPSVEGVSPELVLRRLGPDGYLYSTYRITVLQFTPILLAAYQCTLNLIEGTVVDEQMAELYYRDITAVKVTTETVNQRLKSGEQLTRPTVFSLVSKAGETLRMIIDDPAIRLADDLRGRTEAAVNNVRAMLREHHGGADSLP